MDHQQGEQGTCPPAQDAPRARAMVRAHKEPTGVEDRPKRHCTEPAGVGKASKRWDRTGVVEEDLGHRKYTVRIDGSGQLTDRNKQFLRGFKPATLSQPGVYVPPCTSAQSTPDAGQPGPGVRQSAPRAEQNEYYTEQSMPSDTCTEDPAGFRQDPSPGPQGPQVTGDQDAAPQVTEDQVFRPRHSSRGLRLFCASLAQTGVSEQYRCSTTPERDSNPGHQPTCKLVSFNPG